MNRKTNEISDHLVKDIIVKFPEGIWVTNEDDRMVFFNHAMEIVSGKIEKPYRRVTLSKILQEILAKKRRT